MTRWIVLGLLAGIASAFALSCDDGEDADGDADTDVDTDVDTDTDADADGDTDADADDGGASDAECLGDAIDDCSYFLRGVRFTSVEEHEVGMAGDGGVAMGHWSLSFSATDGSFSWHHSDVVEEVEYTCTMGPGDRELTISGTATHAGMEGLQTGCILVWDDIEYERD